MNENQQFIQEQNLGEILEKKKKDIFPNLLAQSLERQMKN